MKDDVENKRGCHLHGSFFVQKTIGNFHISFHSEMELFFFIKDKNKDLFDRINLSYEFEQLHFGVYLENYKIKDLKHILGKNVISKELFSNFIDHRKHHLEKFGVTFWLELLPYTFSAKKHDFSFQSFCYSISHKVIVF